MEYKKSMIIIILAIFIFGMAATCAADTNETIIASEIDSQMQLSLNNEINVEENVLTANDNSADESGNTILADTNDNIVTNDTFFNYFNGTGALLSNVTSDELIFEGEFGGLGIDCIFINKPIVFKGNGGAVFNGITFVVSSDDVTIDGFSIFQKDDYGIRIGEDNVVISNNYLEFTALDGVNSYGIYASSSNLQILDNIMLYKGNTDGTVVNNAVRIEGDDEKETPATNIVVSDNFFDIYMPSVDVAYDSNTWAPMVMNDAIVFYYCEGLEFAENNVTVKYNDVTTDYGYDSLYAVSVRSDAYTSGEVQSKQVIIENNTIDIEGHSTTYAVYVCADDFSVVRNNITSTSETYLAHGIDVDGPCDDGVVAENYIVAEAPLATYGIYSYQYVGSIENITYDRNIINVTGYASAGMEIVECNPKITDNGILARGNYTYGIIASIGDEGVISDNVVLAPGSNIGSDATGDGLMPKNSMGISVKGDCVIERNIVGSTNIGINLVEKGDITINNNRIYVIPNALIDSYGIYSHGLSNLTVTDNRLYFIGNTDGTVVNNGVRIEGDDDEDEPAPATNIVVSGNTFDLQLPSVDVSYDPDTWAATTMSEGIVFYYCEDLKFTNNCVDLTYNNFTTAYGYDSLYAVSVRSDAYTFGEVQSKHVMIADNEINIDGHSTTYAVYVCADDFSVLFNNITSTSETYLAYGIDVDGPCAEGLVAGNDIVARAPLATYGIYSYQYMGAIENVSYPANTIDVTGYASAGMGIVECNPEITGNVITADGNYTYGIIANIRYEGVISKNEIAVLGSNMGSDATDDSLMSKNSMAISVKGSSTISDNTLESTDIGINLVGDGQITVDSNKIQVKSNTEDIGNHAVVANAVDYLAFTNNEVKYAGATTPKEEYKTAKAYAMYVVNSEVNVENNTFNITVPSLPSDLEQVGDNWVRHSYTEGLVFNECNFSKVVNNEIALCYDDGDSGSIYVIDVLDCDNFVIEHNEIDAAGEDYICGIIVEGDKFAISQNNISVESEYHTCGIDIEESTEGMIDGNVIYAGSSGISYPIYVGATGEPSVEITNNTLVASSYFIVGVESSGKEATIKDNLIDLRGNYTIGIGANVDELIANNNTIRSKASNVGNVPIRDSIATDTTAIKSKKGSVTIIDNFIETTGNYTVDIADDDGTVHDNYLVAKNRIGDDSVYFTGAASVYDNTPYIKVVLFASDLEKVYDDGQLFTVVALDEDDKPVINGTIYAAIGNLTFKADTDEKGVAEFDIELPEGVYNVTTDFLGDYVYGPKQIINTITVTTKDTVIVAPAFVQFTTVDVAEGASIIDMILIDVDGNPLANKTVFIGIDGGKDDYITDGNGSIEYLILANAGEHNVKIEFAGDGVYAENTTAVTVSINKIPTEIIITNETLDLKVYDVFDGLANLTPADAGNLTFVSSDEDIVFVAGNIILAYGKGNATVTVSFAGNDKYAAAENKTIAVTVSLKDASVSVENSTLELYVDGEYDLNATTIPHWLNVEYASSDESVATVTDYGIVVAVGEGTATITVTVGDDLMFTVNSTNVTVTVNKQEANVNVSIPENITVGDNSTVNVVLPEDATGNVTVKVDGEVIDTVSVTDGTADVIIPSLSAGNHTVEIAYLGDDKYNSASKTATITVNKYSTNITAADVTATYKVNKYLVINLTDSKGNPLANSTVTVELSTSKNYTSDENGQIKVKVSSLVPKTYTAKITFAGNNNYLGSEATAKVVVKKATPKITAKTITFKTTTKTKKYTVMLKANGKALKNKWVYLKVNGKTYKAKTNSKGKATFKITQLNKAGKYKATVTFKGNDYYKKATKKTTIKVKSAWKTIQKGSKNSAIVKKIQRALKNHGYYLEYNGHYLMVDGIFWDYTEMAVKEFQNDKTLKGTGKVDEKTARKLGII